MFKRIYIELSNYCNLDCLFCTPKNKNNRMLKLEEFKYIFDSIKDYTEEVCLHILGEPLIHPDIIEIIKYINKDNKRVMISTNGRLINKLSNELINLNIDTFNISLHSSYNLSESDRLNYINSITSFIDQYNLNHKALFNLRLWADSNKEIKESNEKIRNILFNYYKYNSELNNRIKLKEYVILSYEEEFTWPNIESLEYSDGYCLGGKTHLGILSNGEVVICCLDSNGESKLGNIFTTPFETIINSEKYLNTINGFKSNKCYLEICKHCTYKRIIKDIK